MSLSHEHLSEIILYCNLHNGEILIQFPVSHTDMLKLLSTKGNT